ncbi:MAG: aldo/keto reductase [Candidatus Taylorbacteria bacterium CG11_big_fil_rev_8_21_14_0_20_46_11]|uniref:Aldo/keto reductase n=1 Tax=Candidatus Taylorbacteria bacterium CG11_big_fil_rev_8_21_14_0_20_46_11 TaxID=1975025 RepID=A0A2H0KCP5_9BACT|nr:MAG: aldo/keto reductase [Candidatus Taylorbacteria bacterium CG11_big_fil_rev_8_21_14_0_20_46_11]
MELPLFGMGTWGMGGKYEKDPTNVEESVDVLTYGFDLGVKLVDVAELYGEGLSEEIVGRAIKGRRREDIYIISKVWKDNLRQSDVRKAVEGSLKRLGTDYIDLYLVHSPNPEIPLRETMEAMEGLVEDGLVKRIGVSNFSVPLVEEARSYLKDTTLYANQIEYNFSVRSPEKDVLPFSKKEGMHIIAHRPFSKGKFFTESMEVFRLLSQKYQKTPAQIVLNWIMEKGITVIPKAGSKEHLKENFGSIGWSLSPEDVKLLDTSPF